MANHHQVVWGMALCLGLVTCGGCTAVKTGTHLIASYEETAAKPPCQGPPALVVEKAEVHPSKITPGQQLVSRIVYASCYGTPLKGKITRKVLHNGETMIALPEALTYMPGTWALTAYIAIPLGAAPGGYRLETQMQAGAFRWHGTQTFEIIRE